MDFNLPIVSIKCLVYNHEPYLQQCLDGFVMQKTDFPFEVIIHDDASTDNSVVIIREYAEKYPNIIKPIYETENQYSKKDGTLQRIINDTIHPNSKYIAFCEGDDYWIDPLKLQKQVDFMENNPDYTFVFSTVKTFDMHGKLKMYILKKVENRDYTGLEYFLKPPSQTSTFLLRKEILFTDYYKKVLDLKFEAGDIPLVLTCAHFGKLRGFSECMSVYRIHPEGWTRKPIGHKELWNRINAQLKFKFFGNEFQRAAEKMYIRQCIYSFMIYSLKNKKDKYSFISAAYKMSLLQTSESILEIIYEQLHKRIKLFVTSILKL